MQLRSCIAVAVAVAGSCSSNSTQSLGTSICLRSGLKKKKKKNAGEGMEKRKPTYTIGENVNSVATLENSMEVPQKTKNRIDI